MKNKDIIFLPGLNGLRTLAACGVMISHISMGLNMAGFKYSLFGSTDGKPEGWILGEHGVTIFFVLSGFLITYLLLTEKKKYAEVRIKAFYVRRILRIWPLYYLYLFVALFLSYIFYRNNPINSTVPYYLFFLANVPFILQKSLQFLDHFWSIGVEEQFYIFWPWFFKMKDEKLIKVVIVIIFILSVSRILLWYFIPFSVPALFSVVNRFDCMLVGALGAIFFFRKNSLFLKIVDNKYTQMVALLVLFSMLINKFWFLNSIIEIFVVEIITVIIIIGQINIKNRIINFNNYIMDYLGKLSYGIYIIHVLILNLTIKEINWQHIENPVLAIIIIYLTVILITIFLSHVSYYYFETPFLKLKNRFARIKSSGTKTFDTLE